MCISQVRKTWTAGKNRCVQHPVRILQNIPFVNGMVSFLLTDNQGRIVRLA